MCLPPKKSSEDFFKCALCRDTGFCYMAEQRASRRCDCVNKRLRKARLAAIPSEYRGKTIETLLPDPKRHPKQTAMVNRIRNRPEDSYFLAGKNRVGKTCFGWALYAWAVEQGRKAVAVTMQDLLTQYRAWEFRTETTRRPVLLPEDVTNTPLTLFIDEVEKSRPTEFGAEVVFALLNKMLACQHQLIITSNLPVDQFDGYTGLTLREHWSRVDPVWGSSICSRFEECVLITLF